MTISHVSLLHVEENQHSIEVLRCGSARPPFHISSSCHASEDPRSHPDSPLIYESIQAMDEDIVLEIKPRQV